MSKVPEGKARGYWYIDAALLKKLKVHCAEQGRKESHVVEQALRDLLRLPKPTPA